jgi:hypothetical protein
VDSEFRSSWIAAALYLEEHPCQIRHLDKKRLIFDVAETIVKQTDLSAEGSEGSRPYQERLDSTRRRTLRRQSQTVLLKRDGKEPASQKARQRKKQAQRRRKRL